MSNAKEDNPECPVPAGILVIIGGKENKGGQSALDRQMPSGFISKDVLKLFIELIKNKDAPVQVITSGSAEGQESFEEYKKVFKELGRKSVGHIHHTLRQEVLEDRDLLQKVKEAGAIFFSGGDQLLLTSLYGGSEFLIALKERYIREKIVIGGTSAGAMALSTPMIYAGNEEVQQVSGEIKVTMGLEFLKDVCIDTHFVHRGRFVRLSQVVATNPGCIGIGIEEDTAIIIHNGTEGEIAGSGTVIVIEGFAMVMANMKNFTEKKPVSIRNLKVDILAPGDKLSIRQTNPPHK
jgi:cyanophycinase